MCFMEMYINDSYVTETTCYRPLCRSMQVGYIYIVIGRGTVNKNVLDRYELIDKGRDCCCLWPPP